MSTDLETRLREAFDARAAATTTSPDAWARIGRQAERRDHRRSLTLRIAAAAAILVLAVGGAVALLGRGSQSGRTVATGDAASKSSRAEDSADSSVSAPERPTGQFAPAGGGLEVRTDADGSIVVRRDGVETPAAWPGHLTAAVGDDGVVFGVAPAGAGSVQINADVGSGVTKVSAATLALPTGGFRTFAVGGFGAVVGPIRVQSGGETAIATGGGGGR